MFPLILSDLDPIIMSAWPWPGFSVTLPEGKNAPTSLAAEPPPTTQTPSNSQQQFSRPSLDELNYALMALKIRKVRAESQKIELEKANLKMDILVKEEHLDQEYGKDRWRKRLHHEPVEVAMSVCHAQCKGACRESASCSAEQYSPVTCNQSQNRRNSVLSLPHVQIHTAPRMLGLEGKVGDHAPSSCESCDLNSSRFDGKGDVTQTWKEKPAAAKKSMKTEHGIADGTAYVPPSELKRQCESKTFTENLERHFTSFFYTQECDAESQTLQGAKESRTVGKVKVVAKGGEKETKNKSRVKKSWSFGFLGRKPKKWILLHPCTILWRFEQYSTNEHSMLPSLGGSVLNVWTFTL